MDRVGRDLVERGWRRLELDGWSHSDPTGAPSAARVLDDDVEFALYWGGAAAVEPLESAGLVIDAIAALSSLLRPREVEICTAFAAPPVRTTGDTQDRPVVDT